MNHLNYNMIRITKAESLFYLKCLVRELLICPLFELDVYSCVKGTRVYCLGSGQVNVFNHMGGNTFPELLLQDSLPAGVKHNAVNTR